MILMRLLFLLFILLLQYFFKITTILYVILKTAIARIKHNLSHILKKETYLISYDNAKCVSPINNLLSIIDDINVYDKNENDTEELFYKLTNNNITNYISYYCLLCPHYITIDNHVKNLIVLLDQINKNIETYNEDSNIFTTDHIQYISNWNNSYIRNIDSYRMNLQEEYQKNIKNQINNLTTAKDELMRYYTIEYLKCSHTIKDLFFDIFALVLILMIFSLMFLISLPIINLVINNLFLYMNICMTVMWISLKIIFIMIIVFILVANMIGNILYK